MNFEQLIANFFEGRVCDFPPELCKLAIKDPHRLLDLMKPYIESGHRAIESIKMYVKTPRLLGNFVKLLDSPSPNLRSFAVSMLGRLRHPSSAEHLLPLLNNPLHDRHNIIDALGRLSDHRATERLIALLHNPEFEEHTSDIAKALANLGDKRAIEPLFALFNTRGLEPSIRFEAAYALAKLKDRRAIKQLFSSFFEGHDSDFPPDLRKLATEDPRMLLNLMKPYIESGHPAIGNIKRYVATSSLIGEFGKLLYSPSPNLRNFAGSMLVKLRHPDSGKSLLHLLNLPSYGHSNIIDTLGRLGDNTAVKPLIYLLRNPNLCQDVFCSTVRALKNLGDHRATETLISSLGTALTQNELGLGIDAYQCMRRKVMEIFGALRTLCDQRDTQTLLSLIRDPNLNDTCFNGLIGTLETLRDHSATEPLVALLHSPGFEYRYGDIVFLLGASGDHRATEPLVALLRDPAFNKYPSAIVRALGALGDRRATESLVDLLHDPKQRGICRDIINALVKLRDPRVIDYLLPLLRDPAFEKYRYSVVEGLANLGDPRAIEPLFGLFNTCGATHSDRRYIAYALVELKDPRTIDFLLESLDMVPDYKTPYTIEALVKSGDPRVADRLLKMFLAENNFVNIELIYSLAAVACNEHIRGCGTVQRIVTAMIQEIERPGCVQKLHLAQGLALTGNPQAIRWLLSKIDDPKFTFVREAVREVFAKQPDILVCQYLPQLGFGIHEARRSFCVEIGLRIGNFTPPVPPVERQANLIERFPREITEMILSHLPLESFRPLAQASRGLYHIARGHLTGGGPVAPSNYLSRDIEGVPI